MQCGFAINFKNFSCDSDSSNHFAALLQFLHKTIPVV